MSFLSISDFALHKRSPSVGAHYLRSHTLVNGEKSSFVHLPPSSLTTFKLNFTNTPCTSTPEMIKWWRNLLTVWFCCGALFLTVLEFLGLSFLTPSVTKVLYSLSQYINLSYFLIYFHSSFIFLGTCWNTTIKSIYPICKEGCIVKSSRLTSGMESFKVPSTWIWSLWSQVLAQGHCLWGTVISLQNSVCSALFIIAASALFWMKNQSKRQKLLESLAHQSALPSYLNFALANPYFSPASGYQWPGTLLFKSTWPLSLTLSLDSKA